MRVLLDGVVVAGPGDPGGPVYLLGDDHTGGLTIRVGGASRTLPRGNAQQLAERLADFLDATAGCSRCAHPRLDHFILWTQAGRMHGCAYGLGPNAPLAAGLP